MSSRRHHQGQYSSFSSSSSSSSSSPPSYCASYGPTSSPVQLGRALVVGASVSWAPTLLSDVTPSTEGSTNNPGRVNSDGKAPAIPAGLVRLIVGGVSPGPGCGGSSKVGTDASGEELGVAPLPCSPDARSTGFSSEDCPVGVELVKVKLKPPSVGTEAATGLSELSAGSTVSDSFAD